MKNIFFTLLCLVVFVCATGQSARVLIPYRIGNKWGYSDTLGKIKIPVKYDTAKLFDQGIGVNGRLVAVLQLNGKPIVINDLGDVIVPAKYDHIMPIRLRNGFGFYITAKNKHGIYANGKEIIPVVYDELFLMDLGYYQAEKNGKWGVISSEGKIVIPVIHDQIWSEASRDSLTVHSSDNNQLQSYKLESFSAYAYASDDIVPPAEVVAAVDTDIDWENFETSTELLKKDFGIDSGHISVYTGIVYKNGKQGVYLAKETQKIHMFSHSYKVKRIKYFEAYARTQWNNRAALIIASINGKFGLIDETEKQVLPFIYDSIEDTGDFYLLKRNGKLGFFIWNTFYPPIQPAYDHYDSKLLVPVNSDWSFTLFKVISNGKPGFVGENGVAFFKN